MAISETRGRASGRPLRVAVHGSCTQEQLLPLNAGPDRLVDARGTFCPQPVILVQEAARAMAPGEVLLLLADDPGVELDIPAWCMSTGNEFLGLLREKRLLRLLVRRRQPVAPAATRGDR